MIPGAAVSKPATSNMPGSSGLAMVNFVAVIPTTISFASITLSLGPGVRMSDRQGGEIRCFDALSTELHVVKHGRIRTDDHPNANR